MTKEEALREYIEDILELKNVTIEPSEYDENEFEVKSDDEDMSFLVLTEDEGYEYAKEDVKNLIDDIGLEGFSEEFQDYIIENLVDEDVWLEILEEIDEDEIYNDMDLEDILNELDIEYNEDEEYDIDKLRDELVEKRLSYYESHRFDTLEMINDIYGKDGVLNIAKDNIDIDEVAEAVVNEDGVANSLARYDGKELYLGDDLYAYRTN